MIVKEASNRYLALVLLAGVLLCLATPALATTGDDAPAQIGKIREELVELQKQMDRMQIVYEEKIVELQARITALESEQAVATEADDQDELEHLRSLARTEAEREEPEAEEKPVKTFAARGLSLQALNPEISVTGDMMAYYQNQEGNRQNSDFLFRGLGMHFESYLDPYTRFKAAVSSNQDSTKLGEAYMTRYGVLSGLNLTFGKFRQQFGVVNRWHKHGLDQIDFPLALRQIFGEGGLNQTGISADWVVPSSEASTNELTAQLTDGENGRLFSGNTHNTPSILLHYKNYRDLTRNTYFEVGVSYLLGWSDEWPVEREGVTVFEYDSLAANVYGLDFNLLWEPTDRMRYRNVEWRSEFYLLDREILAPDDSGRDAINAWGAFSYLQSKIKRTVDVGVRLDYFEPDTKAGAGDMTDYAPQVYGSDRSMWQVGPYLTWQQSPFVKYRCEYNHLDMGGSTEPKDIIYFQLIFAAGPHKHERY